MGIKLAVILAALMVAASCSDEANGPGSDIAGTWWAVELDGEPVEIGRNTSEVPWLTIDNATIGGNLGCNDAGGSYELRGTRLLATELESTQELCGIPDGSEVMVPTERFLREMLTGGTEVMVADGVMTWTGAGHSITFAAASGEPPVPTMAPRQQFDRLDCAPGVVVESRHAADGVAPEGLALEVEPTTVRVEDGGPLQWWGYDAEGNVVVGVFQADVPNPDYQVVTCAK